MSNFEKWKAAKAAWWSAEREYNAARNIEIAACDKRNDAWETLVAAAEILSHDEKKQAAEYQFGSSPSPAMLKTGAD